MNLLHLHYFYVVAKEDGFTNASQALRIQQPAISRMVKLLEEDFGFKLFEKIGRNVQLTKQGHEVFEHCKVIFGNVEMLKHSLGKMSGECKGPLNIAAAEPIASHFLPRMMGEYLEKHPLVHPNIFSGAASMLFEKIIQGDIEFGMFYHAPELPDKLEIFERKETRYHLVIRKDLRRKKSVIESFIGSREVDDTANKKFPTLERLRKDYPDAKITISSNNLTAHKELVLQGLGVAILPDFLVAEDIKAGKLSDLYANQDIRFQMKFVKRKTTILSPAAAELVGSCLQF